MALYSINNLRVMEVIDVNTGSKLGYIKDFLIDCMEYKILSIFIPRERNSWFSKNADIEIEWDKVIKVGTDVILVNLEEFMLDNKQQKNLNINSIMYNKI